MMIADNIVSMLKRAQRIIVLPHLNVDGDGLGSSIALALALRNLGKNVTVYLEEEIPGVYKFLPGKELVKVYDGSAEKCEVAVALDTGDLERLGKRVELFKDADVTVNIDHHHTNSEFAFYNYVQTSASAVGEIIYQMVKMLDVKPDIDISACLYVAITTDTGGFRFSNTTPATHRIVADLLDKGINVAEISHKVFDLLSREKVRLMGASIDSLELFERGSIAFITITEPVMLKTGAKEEECDGIVNIGRNIRGVEVAVMMRQRGNGTTKVTLRSNEYVDVSSIASMFKGGGHKKAAGFTSEMQMKDLKELLLKYISEAIVKP